MKSDKDRENRGLLVPYLEKLYNINTLIIKNCLMPGSMPIYEILCDVNKLGYEYDTNRGRSLIKQAKNR